MSLTTVEIELERERNELRDVVNAICHQLSHIIVSEFSQAERNIFEKLCEAEYMTKARIGDEWVAKQT